MFILALGICTVDPFDTEKLCDSRWVKLYLAPTIQSKGEDVYSSPTRVTLTSCSGVALYFYVPDSHQRFVPVLLYFTETFKVKDLTIPPNMPYPRKLHENE